MRIYLAGPAVFAPDSAALGERLKRLCAGHGMVGLYPGDLDFSDLDRHVSKERARIVMRACIDMLDESDAVLADLSPFRGPHCDDGTAFELGYAFARGLPIVGYSADRSALHDRIDHVRLGDRLADRDGHTVESHGLPVNAMLAGAIGDIHPTPEAALANLVRLLAVMP